MTGETQPQAAESGSGVRAAALYLLSALAFVLGTATTIYFAYSMPGGTEMRGGWTMSMMWMPMADQSWPAATATFLSMWFAMMVAMMLPSALTMLRDFQRALYARGCSGMPLALAACGYFLVWLAVGGIAYVVGTLTGYAAMRWPAFSRAVPVLSGAALLVAGCIQFTPWKMAALRHCRDTHVRPASPRPNQSRIGWRHGLDQGAACVVCCSGFVLALIVLGAMNLAVMLFVAVAIAGEKLLPKPEIFVRLCGYFGLIAGTVMIAHGLFDCAGSTCGVFD